MRYQIEIYKSVVEDDYENGEIGDYQEYGLIVTLHAETLEEVPLTTAHFLGCDVEEMNAYENRITFSCLETAFDGYRPTENLKALWQEGKCKMWAAHYDCHVTEVWSNVITTEQLNKVGVPSEG